MRAASGPPDYAANEVPPSGFGTFSMTVVPPARWRELLVQLWPPDAGCACGLPMASGIQHEEDEAVFSISLMRRGALKRVRWLVNAIYFAERIAHFTDSGTGAERLTHRVKEIAVTRGRLLQGRACNSAGQGRGCDCRHAHEEEEAVFNISLMRRGALKRVRWLVDAVYVAERIAHFTDSGTGAERLTHRVKEVAVTRGRLLQGI